MADTVLSVRIDEELKQKFMELAQESGINNKELMEVMVSQFEIGKVSDGSSQFNQDFEELQRITKRMNEIYLNLADRTYLRWLESENKERTIKREQEEKIQVLESKLVIIEEKDLELQHLKDEIKQKELQLKEVNEERDNIKDLNRLLRDKNSLLEKEMADSRAKLETAQEILDDMTKLRAFVQDQESMIRRQAFQLEQEQQEKDELIKSFEAKEHELKQALLSQWEVERRGHRLELEELKVEMKQVCLAQLEEVKQKYEERIEELNQKYRDLLGKVAINQEK